MSRNPDNWNRIPSSVEGELTLWAKGRWPWSSVRRCFPTSSGMEYGRKEVLAQFNCSSMSHLPVWILVCCPPAPVLFSLACQPFFFLLL
ncbi:Core Histone Macro-H2A.2 [Manis pentadactyla]|nr:Core Histone Macro-H2A.2 [Manis pentadactyla]